MSGMVLLLNIQLRPLSYRLLPCSASVGPPERPSHVPLSGCHLHLERLPGSVCRQHHRPAMRDFKEQKDLIRICSKNKAHSSLRYPTKKAEARLDGHAQVAPSDNFFYNDTCHETPSWREGLATLALRKLNRQPSFILWR